MSTSVFSYPNHVKFLIVFSPIVIVGTLVTYSYAKLVHVLQYGLSNFWTVYPLWLDIFMALFLVITAYSYFQYIAASPSILLSDKGVVSYLVFVFKWRTIRFSKITALEVIVDDSYDLYDSKEKLYYAIVSDQIRIPINKNMINYRECIRVVFMRASSPSGDMKFFLVEKRQAKLKSVSEQLSWKRSRGLMSRGIQSSITQTDFFKMLDNGDTNV